MATVIKIVIEIIIMLPILWLFTCGWTLNPHELDILGFFALSIFYGWLIVMGHLDDDWDKKRLEEIDQHRSWSKKTQTVGRKDPRQESNATRGARVDSYLLPADVNKPRNPRS